MKNFFYTEYCILCPWNFFRPFKLWILGCSWCWGICDISRCYILTINNSVSQTKFGDLFLYGSSSFLTLNLSAAFLKDGKMKLYKTLEYYWPAYLGCAPWFNLFSFWVGQTLFWRGQRMWGLKSNLMGKIVDSIINGYNLKTDRDNYLRFSESYIDCYRQYMGFNRSCPWGPPTPQELEMPKYSKTRL